MLQCYNRGCGQKFNPNENNEESCRHHPGEPYFHDAYKGWSCCKRKTVDFTEFLNIKGCTLSKHSNEKPLETTKSEKPQEIIEDHVQQVKPVLKKQSLIRPPFESSLVEVVPTVLPALKAAIDGLQPEKIKGKDEINDMEIPIGTSCKNGGCTMKFSSPESDELECQYHPGSPIFHEGMKYWSCCKKKTTDFTLFLNQVGCTYGKHKWIKEEGDKATVSCRYDWHQTPTNVIIAIYAKLYHYSKSKIKINPIRLNVCLIFPDQNNAEFNLDLELRGIIKLESTVAKMFPTKIEITMAKAEAGSWAKLDFPRTIPIKKEENLKEEPKKEANDSESDENFDDLEYISSAPQLSNIL